ncbi:MAG: hypothetical protein JWN46_2201 [Acidimicrobiales bacterium]|nr:hypothetical protein [Acidimicrobiales bacterium]
MPGRPPDPLEPSALVEARAPRVTHAEQQRILFAILLTLLALPLLLLNRVPSAQASSGPVRVQMVAGTSSLARPRHTGPLTTSSSTSTTSSTTTSSTTTSAVPSTTRPARKAPAPTVPPTTSRPTTSRPTTTRPAAPATTRPAPTTTQAPPPPTTQAPPPSTQPPPPPNTQTGQATYYSWKSGNCAHNSLPMGTVVTVTNLNNGRSATCVVGDRGGFGPPTIIDLDLSVFSQIANPSEGRIPVRISW